MKYNHQAFERLPRGCCGSFTFISRHSGRLHQVSSPGGTEYDFRQNHEEARAFARASSGSLVVRGVMRGTPRWTVTCFTG